MADKIDPYDVGALERSLNDSATRVSTIWISFLIFGLYLTVAAGTTTHRQLFLEEPVKLPALNIDLPLWGFYFLVPILFVIFHGYVLLQVLLLNRTAAAYNAALDKAVKRPQANASMRQRLANTLFAQIFAGSPRERDGWLGQMLKAMMWITLAIAPILILLLFQFRFLPYHSHFVTWSHRALIGIELVALFLLWPLVLDARRDMHWAHLFRPMPVLISAMVAMLTLVVATFPSEGHVNIFTGHWTQSVQCERWLQHKHPLFDLRFDRLVLPQVNAIDHQILQQIEKETKANDEQPSQGERTRSMRDRNFTCADFSNYADLRRIDWKGAHLTGANFQNAKLQGATLDDANLRNANLAGVQLRSASLNNSNLQGAYLESAQLQKASLRGAFIQGAVLFQAQLQGAYLVGAHFQGANLYGAGLQGVFANFANFQGANLEEANLQGAILETGQLQAASLKNADLRGASLGGQLQGADFTGSVMAHAKLTRAEVWHAKGADCKSAYVGDLKLDPIIELFPDRRVNVTPTPATPNEILAFIEHSLSDIPDRPKVDFLYPTLEELKKEMRSRLIVDAANDDTTEIAQKWRDCESTSPKTDDASRQFDQNRVTFLRQVACDAQANRKAITEGIIQNWISPFNRIGDFRALLASGLLGEDGKPCAATNDLDAATKKVLRDLSPTIVTSTDSPG